MVTEYIVERKIEPINILIIFLIGLAASLFLLGSIDSFNLQGNLQTILIISTSVLYLIAVVAFLWPKKVKTPIEIDPEIIEREVERFVEKPVIQYIKENPEIKTVEIPVTKNQTKFVEGPTKIALVQVQKKKKHKTKYIGSSYNERFHLRKCRFAGAVKKEYLIEEDDRKFFKLRGYAPCKICNPDKN